jgi:hypothetical protein
LKGGIIDKKWEKQGDFDCFCPSDYLQFNTILQLDLMGKTGMREQRTNKPFSISMT